MLNFPFLVTRSRLVRFIIWRCSAVGVFRVNHKISTELVQPEAVYSFFVSNLDDLTAHLQTLVCTL